MCASNELVVKVVYTIINLKPVNIEFVISEWVHRARTSAGVLDFFKGMKNSTGIFWHKGLKQRNHILIDFIRSAEH